jgi:peroxiredoxin
MQFAREKIYLIVFSIFLSACSSITSLTGKPNADSIVSEIAPEVNASAPDFELTDLSGELVKLSDFSDQVVLVNFWATWCPPCLLEMPLIQQRYDQYAPDLVVLAVNNAEERDVVNEFIKSNDFNFPTLLDESGEIQQLFRVRGYPSSFFIDKDGVIRLIHVGLMTEGQLDENLSTLGVTQ